MGDRAGQPALTVLQEHVADRELPLILDSCEHLVAACAALARRLLQACPDPRLLATSRGLLRVPGEAVFVVPPPGIPDPRAALSPQELAGYDAMRSLRD